MITVSFLNKIKHIRAEKSFWIANFLGWILFIGINIFFQTNFLSTNFQAIGYSFLVGGVGFLMSLILRLFILNLEILHSSFVITIIRAVLIMLVISLITVCVYLIILHLIIYNIDLSLALFLGNFFNFSLTLFIWTLIYISYVYFENQKRLAIEKLELELELKNAELANLRNQLSPHFLFNALNNIRSLILVSPEKARSALINISDLLRYTLNYQKNSYVFIEEELEIVSSYIELNKIHLGDNVNFNIKISDEALKVKIPPLSIQLLLENALKHGEIINQAKVEVVIKKSNNGWKITVINPGHLKPIAIGSTDIGLKNLKQRLEAMYGNKSSLSIFEKNNSVTAEINISK